MVAEIGAVLGWFIFIARGDAALVLNRASQERIRIIDNLALL
jgi:hypothetical protein